MGPGGMRAAMGSGSFDGGGGRNILGIGISAVHDAVLRGGVAKLLPGKSCMDSVTWEATL